MTSPPNAASVALIRDGQVLLIQRAYDPWCGAWTLPGGRSEAGESAEACAIRELKEELDVSVAELRPVMVLTFSEARFRLAVFATMRFEGEMTPSHEISALRWLHPGATGGLATTPDLDLVLARAFALFSQSGENVLS